MSRACAIFAALTRARVCAQLPPVEHEPWYVCAFADVSQRDDPEALGIGLFLDCARRQLTEQVRCEDAAHAAVCSRFRAGDTSGLRDYCVAHLLTARDSVRFAGAPVLSPGNPERIAVCRTMVSQFAAARSDRVVSWWIPANFRGSSSTVASVIRGMASDAGLNMMREMNPILREDFVAGAPVFITYNIAPLRGLANGTPATLYALVWDSDENREAANAFLEEHPDGDVTLPEGLEPSTVLVRPVLSEEARAAWPPELTVVPGDIVVPLMRRAEIVSLTVGDRQLPASLTFFQYDLGFCSTVHKECTAVRPRPRLPAASRAKLVCPAASAGSGQHI